MGKISQSVKMELDCSRARAKFIDKAVDVEQQFSFANARQKVQMVQVLCCDGYGSMLWDLQSNKAKE